MTELWEYPVEIQTGAADGLKCIRNAREAVASLAIDFPKGGPDVATAKKACLRAAADATLGDSAAAAFRVAAKTSGLLRE